MQIDIATVNYLYKVNLISIAKLVSELDDETKNNNKFISNIWQFTHKCGGKETK
jgi:hypothetical protein